MKLWIVGTYEGGDFESGVAWVFEGVFSTEGLAIAACLGKWECFIGPTELDKREPVERVPWEGCYYPCAQTSSGGREHEVESRDS